MESGLSAVTKSKHLWCTAPLMDRQPTLIWTMALQNFCLICRWQLSGMWNHWLLSTTLLWYL